MVNFIQYTHWAFIFSAIIRLLFNLLEVRGWMCIFAQAAQVPFFGALWVLDQFFDGEGGRGFASQDFRHLQRIRAAVCRALT